MTLNNTKNGLFRPWDETKDSKVSSIGDNDELNPRNVRFVEVEVKCEREPRDEEDTSGSSLSSSPAESGAGSSSQDPEEEDTLHKLTSLVDRTILGLPGTENSCDSSSCSEASFPLSSPSNDSPRSAFVPARGKSGPVFAYPPVSYRNVQTRFENGTLLHPELIATRDSVSFEHFAAAAQQEHFALEEAARLLQHHEALVKQSKKLRPKKFRCPHCDVAFSNNGQLKGHIRIHTGERPFKCDEEGCGKTFTRNEELTRHKRIHSGVRPHACPACGKRFGRKDHLKKHARTHEMRGPTIYIPAPGPFPFPAHPPLHPFLFGL